LRGGEEVLLAGDGRFRFPPRGLDLEALRHGPGGLSGNATSFAPTPTLLSAVPDNRGLADIGRNTTALLHIYYWVEVSPYDLFPTLPATGALTLTYQVQGD
jgi:hypothetical protein